MTATTVRSRLTGRQDGCVSPAPGAPVPAGLHPSAGRPVEGADSTPDATLVALGRIVNVHATRGELRLLPHNPDSATLKSGSVVRLHRGEDRQCRRVDAIRRHKRFLLLTLEGCDSMAAAEALVGYDVCVSEAELPPPGPDEIYYFQLLGMAVVNTAGEPVGVVADVFSTGGNDVCVVRAAAKEHLIPLVADIVKSVDIERRCLIIDPLPGLLD